MNPIKIDPETLTLLAKGTLKTTGQTYSVGFLDESHLPQIKAFHDAIIQTLGREGKSFFLPKPAAFFSRHFEKGGGNAVLGIVAEDGEIIAQAIILNPSAAHPETGMVDMDLPAAPDKLTVLQGVGVLPAFRGNGLMDELVRHWLCYAQMLGKQDAIAEIDIRNIGSWSVFLRKGLNLVSMGIDPADGTLVYNAHEKVADALAKGLGPVFNEKANGRLFASYLENIEWHQKLFGEGHKCIAYHKAQKVLIFEKRQRPLSWFQCTR